MLLKLLFLENLLNLNRLNKTTLNHLFVNMSLIFFINCT